MGSGTEGGWGNINAIKRKKELSEEMSIGSLFVKMTIVRC